MKELGKLILLFALAFGTYEAWAWLIPRGGYEFPPTSQIVCMEVRQAGSPPFNVPSSLYDEMIAALSPSSLDSYPPKWITLGTLEIRTADGNSVHVSLFDTREAAGAFEVEADSTSRRSYSGGNSTRLKSVLEEAREGASLKD